MLNAFILLKFYFSAKKKNIAYPEGMYRNGILFKADSKELNKSYPLCEPQSAVGYFYFVKQKCFFSNLVSKRIES